MNIKIQDHISFLRHNEMNIEDSIELMDLKIREYLGKKRDDLSQRKLILIENEELLTLFAASTSFGFTIAQHFSAVERLSENFKWQNNNKILWEKISTGVKTCGLATTHLANAENSKLSAEKSSEGYILSGKAPWSCGFRIFDLIIIGFHTANEIMYALIEYPKTSSARGVNIQPYDMTCLKSSSSVSISFDRYFVKSNEIISIKNKNEKPGIRQSRYVGFELGIALKVMHLINSLEIRHDKLILFKSAIESIKIEIDKILNKIKDKSTDPAISFLALETSRKAVRLLGLIQGSKSILRGNMYQKINNDLIVFDVILQSDETLGRKIKSITNE